MPKFLEAQTRAKVARVKADLRTLNTGLEAYRTDNNRYPLNLVKIPNTQWIQATKDSLTVLTSPLAYLTSVNFEDPFQPQPTGSDPYTQGQSRSYLYMCYEATPVDLLDSGCGG
jgi:type II secretory pathway pseudopilin PulG